MEVTEVDKVIKRIKIHFVGNIASNLTSGRDFSVETRDPTLSTYLQMPFPEPNLPPIWENYAPS